jgi:uncharacterized protein YecT (DUF1311 family)
MTSKLQSNLAWVGLSVLLLVAACDRNSEGTAEPPAAATQTEPVAEETPTADASPTTPCQDAVEQGAMTSCWSDASRTEEERVEAAVKQLDELFAEKIGPEARQHFQEDQRRWREFVAGHCDLYGEIYEGGSAAPMTVAICHWKRAQDRMQQLTFLTEELDR